MLDRPNDDLRDLDEEPPDKSARRENLDAGVSKDLAFEIGDIERHDRVRTGRERDRRNMTILGVVVELFHQLGRRVYGCLREARRMAPIVCSTNPASSMSGRSARTLRVTSSRISSLQRTSKASSAAA